MALQLRFRLHSATHAIPLHRVHSLVGYATLAGIAEDYFLGWLTFHGDAVPVFDLNRVVCDQPTPENFGSRIILIKTSPGAATSYLGLLAAEVTDTVPAGDQEATALDLDSYLPMLYPLIPEVPTGR